MNTNLPLPVTISLKPTMPVDNFMGRESELEMLVSTLLDSSSEGPNNVAVIYGDSGVGKTELALRVIHELRSEYAHVPLQIGLRHFPANISAVQHVLETVIHAVDPFAKLPSSLDGLQPLYYSLLDGKEHLIFVDGINGQDNISLLQPPPSCKMLITTTGGVEASDFPKLRLERLSPTEAESLLLAICPALGSYSAPLATLCGYSPLQLRLAASLIAFDPSIDVRQYIEELSQDAEEEPETASNLSARTAIRRTYSYLDSDSQKLLNRLSIFADSFDSDEAGKVVRDAEPNNTPDKSLQEQLETLTRLSLLEFDAAYGLYRMHDALRDFARGYLSVSDTSDAYLRLGQFCGDVVDRCLSVGSKGSDGFLFSLMEFDSYKLHFKQIWSWLLEQNPQSPDSDALILKLSKLLAFYKQLRFIPSSELLPYLNFGLEVATRIDDTKAVSLLLGELGKASAYLGETQAALDYYELQLALVRQQGDSESEADLITRINRVKNLLYP